MLTLNDFSLLIVSTGKDMDRLRVVYESIRTVYPTNEIVIVYDNNQFASLGISDDNLIENRSSKPVYVSGGYNLALQSSTKKCFVFLHDDTFVAENFLENIIPHVTEKQFCNFTTIEPPLYGDPDTLLKPIRDFGITVKSFNWSVFNEYAQNHINKLEQPVTDSPFGGFFMAGYKNSLEVLGGFDETFQPYFYEDADLIFRMYLAGYKFVHSLNSIVYHMGSLTSRATSESSIAMQTTSQHFMKKWKAPWEYIRQYTLEHSIPYKNVSFKIQYTNCVPQLEQYLLLISDDDANIIIDVDGQKLTQTDLEYLQTLPYLLSSIEDNGVYEVGNLRIHHNQ